jgi:hypothetical protein
MLTFLEAFLGYKETPLAAAMKAMLEVRRPAGHTRVEIGLAWHIVEDVAWHNGGTGGFAAFVGTDLKARTGVVVLSNAFTGLGVDDIGSHLLNPKVRLAHPEPPRPPDQHTEVPIDPKLLDRYTGRYQMPMKLVLEITCEGDRLFAQPLAEAQLNLATPKFELIAKGEKKFFNKVTGSEITFETGPEGRATSLIMHRPGREPMPALRIP